MSFYTRASANNRGRSSQIKPLTQFTPPLKSGEQPVGLVGAAATRAGDKSSRSSLSRQSLSHSLGWRTERVKTTHVTPTSRTSTLLAGHPKRRPSDIDLRDTTAAANLSLVRAAASCRTRQTTSAHTHIPPSLGAKPLSFAPDAPPAQNAHTFLVSQKDAAATYDSETTGSAELLEARLDELERLLPAPARVLDHPLDLVLPPENAKTPADKKGAARWEYGWVAAAAAAVVAATRAASRTAWVY